MYKNDNELLHWSTRAKKLFPVSISVMKNKFHLISDIYYHINNNLYIQHIFNSINVNYPQKISTFNTFLICKSFYPLNSSNSCNNVSFKAFFSWFTSHHPKSCLMSIIFCTTRGYMVK